MIVGKNPNPTEFSSEFYQAYCLYVVFILNYFVFFLIYLVDLQPIAIFG